MKKSLLTILVIIAAGMMLGACNDYETYGEKKDKERSAISRFLKDSAFTVISEAVFHEQGDMTYSTKDNNQFVYLTNNGVYLQIMRKGCGKPLQDGERADLLVRFLEISIFDSTAIYNDTDPYSVDVMNITRTGSTYTASFTEGLMKSSYSQTVPSGWLAPFSYINVGRPRSEDDEVAKVRLIVPHTQGHSLASSYVRPYYYEITFERKIDLVD
jgi:hypothetical protein